MDTNRVLDPADLFFGLYRRKVLGLLLLHPGESFHLREIARATHTQPGTVRRELSLLTDAGVIERMPQGSQICFRANEKYPIYDELRSILKKTSGAAGQLRDALASVSDKITMAFIYGSVASGKEGPHSDIDLMVVGSVDFEAVIGLILPYQEELRREINPHVYSLDEFLRKARESGSFIASILKRPKILVLGDTSELGQLGQDWAVAAT